MLLIAERQMKIGMIVRIGILKKNQREPKALPLVTTIIDGPLIQALKGFVSMT